MKLGRPSAPFERLETRGKSVTIDVDAKNLVIPTGNIEILPTVNEFTLNPSRTSWGLENSIVQDKNIGSLSIDGDGCYLQTIDGSYTGKSIGAGKLAETFSITDSGTTGIALTMNDGNEIEMLDGNIILLSPPSAIVEQFQVRNISSNLVQYTVTVVSLDNVSSISLYNISNGSTETVSITKISTNEYSFSKTIEPNSSESLQFTIVYENLNVTQSFSNDANVSVGIENMSESWIAWLPKAGKDIDFIHFSERPKQLELKQNSDGSISQIIISPGNGVLYHGRITHPNHSKVSGTGYVPDCLNKNMQGSVTRFLQAHGMKTDFPSNATLTTWIVPAISDTKILPLSTISEDLKGDEISLRMCPGEYGCASFVVQSDKDIKLEIEASDLICGENIISKENIDLKTVKCWYQGGYNSVTVYPTGKFLTPELLVHDEQLVISNTDWEVYNSSHSCGKNFVKDTNGNYIDISGTTQSQPVANIYDSDKLLPINLLKYFKKQMWISFDTPNSIFPGIYAGKISLKCDGHIIKIITISLEILPFTLERPIIEYGVYHLGQISPNTSDVSWKSKTAQQYEAEIKDIVKHGIKNAILQYPQIDDTLAQEMEIRQQCGMDTSTIYYLPAWAGDIQNPFHIQNITSDSINEIKTFFSQYGMIQLYLYGKDESDLTDLRAKITMYHDNGVKLINTEFEDSAITDIADVLDLLVCGSVNPMYSTLYHSYTSFDNKTHKIFSYTNPPSFPEYPRTFRLNYGLLLWQNNYDGVMEFAYQNGMGSAWNDFINPEFRNYNFTYPSSDGVIDTVQWEGFAAAIIDMRYLATLQAAITETQSIGVVTTDIETWLAMLKTTDLSNADLDLIRSQMIDYILELQSSENYSAFLMLDGNPLLFADGNQLFLED